MDMNQRSLTCLVSVGLFLYTGCGSVEQAPPPMAAPGPTSGVLSVSLVVGAPTALPRCTSAVFGTLARVETPPSLWSCQSGRWVEIPCTTVFAGAVAYSSAPQGLWACAAGVWTGVALPSGAAGPPGPPGAEGSAGVPGAPSLIRLTPEPAGGTCPGGGTRIDTGLDRNGDGALGAEEIDQTAYVCNGNGVASRCGDGMIDVIAHEQCDTGGESTLCDLDCTVPACGDGVVNQTAGEECDDGNRFDTDGCSPTCKRTALTPPPLTSCPSFPADNPWNQDISTLPVHPQSDSFVAAIGGNKPLWPTFSTQEGIPVNVVGGGQTRVAVSFMFPEESDAGFYPLPAGARIEEGGDAHLIVVDSSACRLYELAGAMSLGGASWTAVSGAMFDLTSNALRPLGFTSADPAGLPIFPGLVRHEEVVEQQAIHHALRFSALHTDGAFISPARHFVGPADPALPPMGLRVRLKASHDCSALSVEAQVVCDALKRYGMFLADRGTDWGLSGAPDARWNNVALTDLRTIHGDDFEAVDTGPIER
jgi:cysteine-rich repeat protein